MAGRAVRDLADTLQIDGVVEGGAESGVPQHRVAERGGALVAVEVEVVPVAVVVRDGLEAGRGRKRLELLQAGIHPKVVSERLGHATIGITLDTYSHAISALQEEAAALIAGLVFASE